MQSQQTDRSRVLLAITAVCLVLGLLIAAFLPQPTGESAAMRKARAIYAVVETEEWSSGLTTHTERLRMVQIPQDLIAKLTSQEIVLLILEYPFAVNLYAYSSYSAGFTALADICNLVPALLGRKDAAAALLAVYKEYPLPSGADLTEEQALSYLRCGFLETLLAQPQIEALFTEQQLNQVFQIATEKQEQLQKTPGFGGISQYFRAKAEFDSPGL